MGHTVNDKTKQEILIKKSIESNDKKDYNKIKNNNYENI